MKKTPKPRDTVQRLKETIHKQPAVFAVYVALRLIVLAELVMSIIRGEYESAFICLLVLALFILPFFIQQNFGIQLPSVLEIIILLFIFAAEILGELECYFITYPNWDSMLHTTTGFLCAATGFALIDILNRNSRIKFQLSPVYVALAAFCFSMTVGVLWEFFEFGMDRVFHLDMQKDTVVQSITSVMLDPTNSNTPITIDGIHSVAVNGTDLGFDGYHGGSVRQLHRCRDLQRHRLLLHQAPGQGKAGAGIYPHPVGGRGQGGIAAGGRPRSAAGIGITTKRQALLCLPLLL